MPVYDYHLQTKREELINITPQIADAIQGSSVREGTCVVWCPHTTAGITVNENADPDVVRDLLLGLERAYPDRPEFRHAEGNSAAHLKSSAMGCAQTLIVQNGRPLLGTWQGVYFCEFDGPRNRRFFVKVQPDPQP